MRIERLEFCEKDMGWRLNATDFFPDLTLLVGVSGVGKTKILQAIRTLKRIARRSNMRSTDWGIAWRINFTTSGTSYVWEGEYEGRPDGGDELGVGTADWPEESDEDNNTSPEPKILKERLCAGEEVIIERNSDMILFQNKQTPKLSPFKSALALLKEEESVKPVVDGFGHIAYMDETVPKWGEMITNFDAQCKRYINIRDIQESDLTIYNKMAILYWKDIELFKRIVSQFREVFPLVEDVKFVRMYVGPFAEVPDLKIKEVGVDRWIPERQISSGMYRVLIHLGSVALCPEESVILIDEFENSLGINCLDAVTEDIMGHRHHLQFLVTSHHPYIINNIPPNHWKLVTRRAGEVHTVGAAEAGIGKSHHEAFIQLINSPLYQDGLNQNGLHQERVPAG